MTQAEIIQWQEIKIERDRRMKLGGYHVEGKWFHSDADSRTQQLGLARKADLIEIKGGDMDAPMPRTDDKTKPLSWKTMDGSWVAMTPNLAKKIFEVADASDSALYAYSEYLKYVVEHTPNPMTVDIFAGWPTAFTDLK